MFEKTKQKFDRLLGRDDIIVLGLESSCDETAAAITCGRRVLSSAVVSQAEIHKKFGGVVPEVASRNHTVNFTSVIDDALKNANLTLNKIDAVAVTCCPGLIGPLLIGVSTAKALCFAKNIPLVSVNHIQAHICANYAESDLAPPFLALVASGGHTSIIDVTGYNEFNLIGRTTDDAIGEAFDKVARIVGLPYPGGPNVDERARQGKPIIEFMRSRGVQKDYSLSYSGLKTAVVNYVHKLKQRGETPNINDICASFTRTAVDMLADTVFAAAADFGHDTIVIAGGVASNSYLRQTLQDRANGKRIIMPPPHLCTDNAVMVALRGFFSAKEGKDFSDLSLNASSVV